MLTGVLVGRSLWKLKKSYQYSYIECIDTKPNSRVWQDSPCCSCTSFRQTPKQSRTDASSLGSQSGDSKLETTVDELHLVTFTSRFPDWYWRQPKYDTDYDLLEWLSSRQSCFLSSQDVLRRWIRFHQNWRVRVELHKPGFYQQKNDGINCWPD